MSDILEIKPIAYYHGPFGSKFGIPRQSSLAADLEGRIVFEPEFRIREALRGLEGFSRIWLLWGFSANKSDLWHPTVRPPRLGGNTQVGVFATRSPFRPNSIGLSAVELYAVDDMELVVRGADLADGTPIYDIKPYIVYADSFPDSRSGFAASAPEKKLEVIVPQGLGIPAESLKALEEALSLDPRPAFHDSPDRIYAMPFCGKDVRFRVEGNVLTVLSYE